MFRLHPLLLLSLLATAACRGDARSSEPAPPAPAPTAPAPTAPAPTPAAPAPAAPAPAAPAPAAPAPTLSCQVGGAVLAVAPSRAAGVDCYVLREGAEPAAFVKALDSDATDDADALCPQVYAIRGGTATRLKADTGPLVRTSDCCNVTRLEAKGEARLVARGAGPDCFGGRDEAELDAAYAITGEGLRAIAR